MAWTTDLEKARFFATRWVNIGAPAAYVYRTKLESIAILCDIDALQPHGGRGECEIVVDPRFLRKIERIEKIIPQPIDEDVLEAKRRAAREAMLAAQAEASAHPGPTRTDLAREVPTMRRLLAAIEAGELEPSNLFYAGITPARVAELAEHARQVLAEFERREP